METTITGWDNIDAWLRNVGQMLHVLRGEFAIMRAYLEDIPEVRVTFYRDENGPHARADYYWSVAYDRPWSGRTVYVWAHDALINLLSTDAQRMTDVARAAVFSCIGDLKENARNSLDPRVNYDCT